MFSCRSFDVRQEVEVWSIFVRPAVLFPDYFLRLNKANLANPFHHFEVRWFFDAQA